MKTDKNTIIGFSLLAVLMFVYFWQVNKQNSAMQAQQKQAKDSIERVEKMKQAAIPTAVKAAQDSADKVAKVGNFVAGAFGNEQLKTLENELIKVTFTNKGGQIKSVQLKQYKNHQQQLITLGDTADSIGYAINTSNISTTKSNELFFEELPNTTASSISYQIKDSLGRNIKHTFTLAPNSYAIGWDVDVTGANSLFTSNTLNFNFKVSPVQAEASQVYERQMTNVCFSEGNEFDYISSKKEHSFEKPVQWISSVQQFFNTTLIAKNSFSAGKLDWQRKDDSSKYLGTVNANLQLKLSGSNTEKLSFQYYFGPNDFKILKQQAAQMDKIINLGRDIYAFVRPINQYIIMPVFGFFAGLISNFGWVILLLTVFIRLFTSPLTYKSYVSGAKMKILRPEMDALKQKFGTDQQGYAMEQMKLFREAGVNPMGGCLPALLQLPIFISLYSFFNSNILLRGQSFLWAKDLSQYDVIAKLPFSIPLGFGDHISLFTITAVLTSFFISIYNMASTPTQDNPAMKYMPYIFPVMMLFFFNRLPSALTWYYTVSNSLTLLLQFIIQKYIINHDKLVAQINDTRKNPKKQNKWQERYNQMLESQKKVQELKNKSQKK